MFDNFGSDEESCVQAVSHCRPSSISPSKSSSGPGASKTEPSCTALIIEYAVCASDRLGTDAVPQRFLQIPMQFSLLINRQAVDRLFNFRER